jgi:hypothetical protein
VSTFWNYRLFCPYYDDPPKDGDGTPKKDDGKTPEAGAAFTPEQQTKVDQIIKERLKKTKIEQDKLVQQLETLKSTKNLSDEEKTNLQKRIDDMQSTLFTKEEIAAKEKKELETRLSKDIEKANNEAKSWRERYTRETVERALLDAAVEHKAVKPKQMVDLLINSTRLVEDTGNPGNFIAQTKFTGKDKDGKPVTLDLPVKEAMKQMRETTDEYGNLFISDAAGGIGGTAFTPESGKGLGNLLNTDAYIAARKKGMSLDQVKVRR